MYYIVMFLIAPTPAKLGVISLPLSALMYVVADASPSNEIDIRNLAPAERHGRALQLATELAVGASFILVNDRDFETLRHQFETKYRHQFFWNYLDEGPDIWRVHIGRLQAGK